MWGGVIYVLVYRQKVKAVPKVKAVGLVRWLHSSHYSMVGVVKCGNQKVIGTLDSLLLHGSVSICSGVSLAKVHQQWLNNVKKTRRVGAHKPKSTNSD